MRWLKKLHIAELWSILGADWTADNAYGPLRRHNPAARADMRWMTAGSTYAI